MTHAYNIPNDLDKLHLAAEWPKRAPVLDSSFLAAWDGIEAMRAMRARQDLCWKASAYAPPSRSIKLAEIKGHKSLCLNCLNPIRMILEVGE